MFLGGGEWGHPKLIILTAAKVGQLGCAGQRYSGLLFSSGVVSGSWWSSRHMGKAPTKKMMDDFGQGEGKWEKKYLK